MTNQTTFDSLPCFLELMGHNKVAARVSESYGGLLRLDIPKTQSSNPFIQFIMPSAIYRITVVTEETMNMLAESFCVKPLEAWDIHSIIKRQAPLPEPSAFDDIP